MQVERTHSENLAVNSLPDGSVVIVDSGNETVFALNAAAGAAWNATSRPTTLRHVTEQMRKSFDASTSEEIAQQALSQLEQQKLIKLTGAPAAVSTRRQFVSRLGTAAAVMPLVVSMPLLEQRAHATVARSGNSGGNGGGNNNPPPPWWWWF